MAIADAVLAARAVFPPTPIETPDGTHSLITVMVAIAGAESDWDPRTAGDPGLRGASCTGMARGRLVLDATSWGLWQIHNCHADFLRARTGTEDPCRWADWLYDPLHNALAAQHILGSDPQHGLANWSTWGGRWTSWLVGHGPYRKHLAEAAAAVGS